MQKLKQLLLLFLIEMMAIYTVAQDLNEFGFAPWTNLSVEANNHFLRDPWAGGLNNVQFGKIDFNNDGVKDLLIFDRHGDRLLPFTYHPDGASPGFNYAPEFRRYFPQFKHWFQVLDYNNDGFPDIFTYTPGGIMVYRNKGEAMPAFEKAVDPYLTSLQGSIYTNLLVTYVDYPAIEDLDGDGDLDILTFWGLGSFIEYHQNRSVELYGNADSLVFEKTDNCWGRFAEDDESNIVMFDTCANFKSHYGQSPPKHTGSTFLLTDITGNGVFDLVLGDVDYSNVVALRNNGNNVAAEMVEQLPPWPVNEPVKLWSFPLVQKIDLYNDGTEQLLVSPFDPSLTKSRGSESVWLYSESKNSSGTADYEILTRSFLQDKMIDLGLGAYPVFVDVNGDQLTDLLIGNYGLYDTCIVNLNGQLKCDYSGRLHLYINNGSIDEPSFQLADDDFGHLSQLALRGLYPALNDLDGDGDLDLLVGNKEGDLLMLTNITGAGSIPEYENPVAGYQNIQVEGFSTPAFVDIDSDGKTDLVVGSLDGRLSYYQNTGTMQQPVFTFRSDYFGHVNVTDELVSYTGYSVPCFFKTKTGELRLLAGSESGLLKYYRGITDEPNQAFVLADPDFMYIEEGIRTAPAWADLNNDGYPELAVGNYSGGVTLFKGTPPGPSGIGQTGSDNGKLLIRPNPGNGQLNISISRTGEWQLSLYTVDGLLLNTIPVAGPGEIELSISSAYSGIVIAEARNKKLPWLVLREKAVVIR